LALNTTEDIVEFIERFEKESKAITEEVLRLCWNMRGGLTYEEGMLLSITERKIIANIVKDNLEIAKKSGLPYF
jgi:hypothetical protein